MKHINGSDYLARRLESVQSPKKQQEVLMLKKGVRIGLMVTLFAGSVIFILFLLGVLSIFMGGFLLLTTPRHLWESKLTHGVPLIVFLGGVWVIVSFVMTVLAFLGVLTIVVSTFVLTRITGKRYTSWKDLLSKDDFNSEIARLKVGIAGENAVTKALKSLDDSWILFSGVVVKGVWGDIDHVLIGPAGIFALEVKNWIGKIRFDENQSTWYRVTESQGTENVKSPSRQINRNATALAGSLQKPVTPVVVFTHPRCLYDGPQVVESTTILLLDHLYNWLRRLPETYTDENILAVATYLQNVMEI